ncbi:Triose-phosphate Transporter [Nowakowskiella sp. JEL0407]|nr:Triose-phosphate Transporter [Nowakowskiella sp. JEL0407]
MPSRSDYLAKVLPCGVATGMDIGLSNSSLKTISLSFYTMVKSAAPVFVLLFAFMFGLEKPTLRLLGVILVIVVGVVLMVVAQSNNLIQFTKVQTATVLSGLRWALVHLLLEKESMGMNNPLATTIFLAPLMALTLLFFSVSYEGLSTLPYSPHFATFNDFMRTSATILSGAVLAFLMLMSEYRLISETSVVTFSISGICKEILTITVSHFIFGDTYTSTNIFGLVVSLIGLGMYNYVRISAMHQDFLKTQQPGSEKKNSADEVDLNEDDDDGSLLERKKSANSSRIFKGIKKLKEKLSGNISEPEYEMLTNNTEERDSFEHIDNFEMDDFQKR